MSSCAGRRFHLCFLRSALARPAEYAGGKEDSVKGTQEGFLSREITRRSDGFWPLGQNPGSTGNIVAGATQEGFLSRGIARRSDGFRPMPKSAASQRALPVVRLHKGIVKFLSFLSLANMSQICYNF